MGYSIESVSACKLSPSDGAKEAVTVGATSDGRALCRPRISSSAWNTAVELQGSEDPKVDIDC